MGRASQVFEKGFWGIIFVLVSLFVMFLCEVISKPRNPSVSLVQFLPEVKRRLVQFLPEVKA